MAGELGCLAAELRGMMGKAKEKEKEKAKGFLGKEAIDLLIKNGERNEEIAMMLMQNLLQNRFIIPSKPTIVEKYENFSVGERYTFQPLGEGQSVFDFTTINWEQLVLQMFASKSSVKVKHRWKNLKKYNDCFLGNEAVDWLSSHFKIIRPLAITIGEEMMRVCCCLFD
jgi:hypothetical protein